MTPTPPELDAERRLAGLYLLHLMPGGLGTACLICGKTSWTEMLRNGERYTTTERHPVDQHPERFIWCDGRAVDA